MKQCFFLFLSLILLVSTISVSGAVVECYDYFDGDSSSNYSISGGTFNVASGTGLFTQSSPPWHGGHNTQCLMDSSASYELNGNIKYANIQGSLIGFYGNGSASYNGDGMYFQLNMAIFQGFAYGIYDNASALDSTGINASAAWTQFKLRYTASNNNLTVRYWANGSAEPSTWNLHGVAGDDRRGDNVYFGSYQDAISIDFWNLTNLDRVSEIPSGSINVALNQPGTGNTSSEVFGDLQFNFTPTTTSYGISHCEFWSNESGTFSFMGNSTSITNNTINNITPSVGVSDDDGTFVWNMQCYDNETLGTGTTNYTIIIDTTKPVISLNSNNAWNTQNISVQNNYATTLIINQTYTDERLVYAYQINITKLGVSYFNISNSILNVPTTSFYHEISTSTIPTGLLLIEQVTSDPHTNNEIKDYEVKKFMNQLEFNTEEGNKVKIKGVGAWNSGYQKVKDRYQFSFNYILKSEERTFTLESDKPIVYLPESKYEGHFVIWDNNKKLGNWIDFEGTEQQIKVKYITPYKYEITVTAKDEKAKLNNTIQFNSIGGLNVEKLYNEWYKGSYTNTYDLIGTSGSRQNFFLNISRLAGQVTLTSAKFYYNHTQLVTKTFNSSTYQIHNATLIVPEEENTYPIKWEVNVLQHNGSAYTFNITQNQTLLKAFINISLFDEINQSPITEAATFYMEGTDSRTLTGNTSIKVSNLSLGEYFIQAQTSGYTKRGVFITINNQTNNLKLYLLKDVDGRGDVDFYLKNFNFDNIEDVRLTFQRKYNESFITVAQYDTDFAGQARLFLDKQYEYNVLVTHPAYTDQEIGLRPLLTYYTIKMQQVVASLYENVFEGITYSIIPKDRVINLSNGWQDITFKVYSSTSDLEYFGVRLDSHDFTCNPSSCVSNVSTSPSGGSATVSVLANETGRLQAHFFFKRQNKDLQYVNGREFLISIVEKISNFQGIRSLGNFAEQLSTIQKVTVGTAGVLSFVVVGAMFGLVGVSLILITAFGIIFFMITGFIPYMVGIVMVILGIMGFVMMVKEQ